MFTRKSALLLLSLLIAPLAKACDICGTFIGITPYDNQSALQFQHRYRIYSGYPIAGQSPQFFPAGAWKKVSPAARPDGGMQQLRHGSHTTAGNAYAREDYEAYRSYELRGKYFLHPRIELGAILPFNQIGALENGGRTSHFGLGDPSFYCGYHLLRRLDEVVVQQRLIVALGIKIPSGNYYARSDDGDRLPLMHQPGTGSTDGLAYVSYIAARKKTGASVNLTGKLNGRNYYGEKVADSFTGNISFFGRFRAGENTLLLPSVQVYAEHSDGVLAGSMLLPGTRMHMLLLGPGFDMSWKNFGLNTVFQFCLAEKTEPTDLSCAGRIAAGISYNFNQTKYLLKQKKTD